MNQEMMNQEMMNCFDPHLLLEIHSKNPDLSKTLKKFTNLNDKSREIYNNLSILGKPVVQKIQNNSASSQDELHLRKLALYEYSIGAYHEAAENLFFLTVSKSKIIRKEALWGKLACEILLKNFKAAEKVLEALVKEVDEKDYEIALKERVFLCHWVLFLDVSVQLDLFFKPAYMNAIQMASPWLMKYVIMGVLISKKYIKEMAKLLSCESDKENKEATTGFFEAIYCGSLDLKFASEQLEKFQVSKDYFLEKNGIDLIQSCQTIIFQVLVKTHLKVDLGKIGSLLHLNDKQVVAWIQNYQKTHSNVVLDDKYVSILKKKSLTIGNVIDYLNQFKTNGSNPLGQLEIDDSFVGPKYAIS